MSFSRALLTPTFPGSGPPCPASITIVPRFLISVSEVVSCSVSAVLFLDLEDEIREEIKSHKKFICQIDRRDVFADIMEADSLSWIKALKWVLEEENE